MNSKNSIASQPILDKGEIALLSYSGSDESIAAAARVSYSKGTKQVSTDAQLIRYLIRNAHTSPLEQTFLQFYIKVPIFVMRQWMRHRTWSYNEISGRYSEIREEAYLPQAEHITTQDMKNKQARTDLKVANNQDMRDVIRAGQEVAFRDYKVLLNNGVARELARVNLPLSTYTEVIACVDLHNLLHFLKLRMDSHAQYEIRVAAEAIYEIVKGLFPVTVGAWEDCSLNSFTLTGFMQTVLADLMSEMLFFNSSGRTLAEYPEVVSKLCDRYTWPSKSERQQFEQWVITKLRV